MSEYSQICRNMPECVNMSKSNWMAFVLHFLIVILCLLEHVVTYFNVYTKLEVIVWWNMRLLFEETKLIFTVIAGSIWFNFYLKLNIFTSKISNLLLPLGAEGPRAVNLDISMIKSWTTTKHWNQINRDQFTNPATSIILTKLY